MAFPSNPLSLSVPDPLFESWLRDNNYLEILDQRTTSLAASAAAASDSPDSSSPPTSSALNVATASLFRSLFSAVGTLLSLFTFNPIAKLTAEDFAGETPSWTVGFFGGCESYSFPSSAAQAKLRACENVKRFARNYACLVIVALACTLYQMPLALVGLISCLAMWDLLKVTSDKWRLDDFPIRRQFLVRVAQCATVIILFFSNVQMALIYALGVSYVVMILHAAFRKLTPTKQLRKNR
uniref:PRA1 family protein n=1 Tax=Kalanchoe fedtschenkoi TaxID=63787 RepID=A0A7N0SXX2_KALFE